jgi:glycosyltransferase involved in cell wall biosynthesis
MNKIVISTNSIWNVLNYRLNLVKMFCDMGVEVHILAPIESYENYKKMLNYPIIFHHIKFDRRKKSIFESILVLHQYIKILRKINPSHFFSFTIKPNIFGGAACFLLNIKSVPNVTGLGSGLGLNTNSVQSNAIFFIYKWILSHSYAVFFQNENDMRKFSLNSSKKPPLVFKIPGSGVDLDKFYPFFKPDFIERGKPCIFLMVARLLRDKGVYEYIEAAKILRAKGLSFRIQLLGAIDENNPSHITLKEIHEIMKEFPLEYLGESNAVIDHLKRCDAVVLPSYAEGMSRALLEAGAVGLPLIASSCAGSEELVIDGFNGFLCEVRSSLSLANAMERFLRLSANDRKRMSQNSTDLVVKNFDEKIVLSAYSKVFKKT